MGSPLLSLVWWLLPSLTPRPSLRLRPMPTTATTDTVWATPDTVTDTVWATPDTDTDTVWDTVATTARGLLTPSPPLLLSPRLMPMLTTATTDTVWATPDMATATDTDMVWATTDTPDTDTATDTPDTDTDMDAATDTATATATTARFPNCLPNNISKQFYIKIFH